MNWEVIRTEKIDIPSDMRMGRSAVGFIATVPDGRNEYKAFGITKDKAQDRALDHVNGIFTPQVIKRNVHLSKEEKKLLNRIREGEADTLELRKLINVSAQRLSNMIASLRNRGIDIKRTGRVKMNQRSYTVYGMEG